MKAVVLLSGGLDSYTAGGIARAEGFELYASDKSTHARSMRPAASPRRSASPAGSS
jgi:7-cyano-7-deazaguanine synthase in queuosine biosynthesis